MILQENDDDNNEGMEIVSRVGTVVGRNIAGATSAIWCSSK